jgi:hypothetical protein
MNGFMNDEDKKNSQTRNATLLHVVWCKQVVGEIIANAAESDISHELHVVYLQNRRAGRSRDTQPGEAIRDVFSVISMAQFWLDYEMGQPAVLLWTRFDVVV